MIEKGFSDSELKIWGQRQRANEQRPLEIEVEELERIVVKLDGIGGSKYLGLGNDETKELPIGSTLDQVKGIFYWIPGPGFLGKHVLYFAVSHGDYRSKPVKVVVIIVPKKYRNKLVANKYEAKESLTPSAGFLNRQPRGH